MYNPRRSRLNRGGKLLYKRTDQRLTLEPKSKETGAIVQGYLKIFTAQHPELKVEQEKGQYTMTFPTIEAALVAEELIDRD